MFLILLKYLILHTLQMFLDAAWSLSSVRRPFSSLSYCDTAQTQELELVFFILQIFFILLYVLVILESQHLHVIGKYNVDRLWKLPGVDRCQWDWQFILSCIWSDYNFLIIMIDKYVAFLLHFPVEKNRWYIFRIVLIHSMKWQCTIMWQDNKNAKP